MDMSKGNNLYIGVSVGFLTLAMFQLFYAEMLPISIYEFIAWASFELTLLELIKSISNHIKDLHLLKKDIVQKELERCNKQIDVFSNYEVLYNYVEKNKSRTNSLISTLEQFKKEDNTVKVLNYIVSIITAIQIAIIFIQMALTIIRPVRNNILTNRAIGILGLMSFSFLMLSYYLNNVTDEFIADVNEKTSIESECSKYYLDLMEKSMESESGNAINKDLNP